MEHGQITQLLDSVRNGDEHATQELFSITCSELRRLAESAMRNQQTGHTLQPTALVNEAVVKILAGGSLEKTENRSMFYAIAARAMRSVLVDHARRRAAVKRNPSNGKCERLLGDVVSRFEEQERVDLLALDEALTELKARSKRQHDTVMMHFFAGLHFKAIADHLGVSLSTVEKDWSFARAWLRRTLDAS